MQREKFRTLAGIKRVAGLRSILVGALLTLSNSYQDLSWADAPKRVVSANLCADQLLLALADPAQIVSLSPFAGDPQMSFMAEAAKAFPVNRGAGEALIVLQADLVLVGPYDNRYTRDLLAARKTEFLVLAPWESIAGGIVQIRDLAARLRQSAKGERLIADIEQSLEMVRGIAANVPGGPRSLVLHRRGYVFHAGVTGEILALAGLHDAAPELGVKGGGFVPLERLLVGRPDFLIVAGNAADAEDQGEAVLLHPALLNFFPLERRLVVPDILTLCGGPSTPVLAERIAAEIRRKVLRR